MYMDGGQLTALGINPYDYAEDTALRKQLRVDEYAYLDYTALSQDLWNYCAASHLPFTQLNLAVAYLTVHSAMGFRLYFAFFDAILCGLIMIFVVRHLKINKHLQFLAIVSLGVCSPFLISWGIINPGDKGTETLLIVAFLLATFDKNVQIRFYLGAVLLGLSIAYKALGVLLFPIALSQCWSYAKSQEKPLFTTTLLYILIASLACIIWFIPFMPEMLYPIMERWHRSSGDMPIHSSLWRLIAMWLPTDWKIVRNSSILLLLAVYSWALLKNKMSVGIFSGNLIWIFVGLLLTTSGVDRMNMAFVPAILLAIKDKPSTAPVLLVSYTIGGCIILFYPLFKHIFNLSLLASLEKWDDINFLESIVCLLLSVVYFTTTFYHSARSKSID
jgi:hypothetical protein